ncbi:MAG: crossover junction endodeoxyribonuclease RuvC [Gemmatimonadetes bacterium]|nr:crossover junction endodeoxyribonuclease RuvC [Gemmatimonadota bacterium]
MIVLGIDPGTGITGYGVVALEGDGAVSLCECGVIRTDASDPLPQRIRAIFDGVGELLERHDPDVVVVEDVFQGKNARSALVLGHTRGAILLAAALGDRQIAEYTPAEVKNAVVGRGRATKDQVGFMVKQLLRLSRAPEPSDAADGVAAALCHCLVGAPRLSLAPSGPRLRARPFGARP